MNTMATTTKMAGKHDTTEPSWRRPLAQKLTGFMNVRHGSSKSRKSSPDASDEKGSIFRFKRQKKTAPESALEFKPLDVDLDQLEALRLSEGWLETDTQSSDDQEREQQPQPQPPAVDNSTTPIADLFVSKSVLDVSTASQPGRGGGRPFSMVETSSITYIRTSADLDSRCDAPATGSILDRGRPIEGRRYVTDPLIKKIKDLRPELPSLGGTTTLDQAAALQDPPLKLRPYDVGGSAKTKQDASLHLQPRKEANPSNRHSMYAGAPPSLNSEPARTKTAAAQAPPRSSSATPRDRIRTWQKSVTSAPTSTGSSGSALAPGAPSTQPGPAQLRKVSPRGGVMGNRLAWIRELEEKKSSSGLNRDLPVLKKQAGSVSDKLAMFESKQAAPASRFPPLTRSNSTTSRLSSTGLESTSSAYGNSSVAEVTTPRTSIDTVRSGSHRASSVLSYYDDSFREKMESVVGSYDKEKEKEKADEMQKQQQQRVTTQFVPVKSSEKGQEEPPQASQSEAGPSDIESEKGEDAEAQPPRQSEPDLSPSRVEPEKAEKQLQPHQPEAGASNVGSEEDGEEKLQSAQPDAGNTEILTNDEV